MINKNDIRIGFSGFAMRVRQFGSDVADPMVIVDLVDHTGSVIDRVTVQAIVEEGKAPLLGVITAGQQQQEDTSQDTVPAEDPTPEPTPDPESEEPGPEEPDPAES